MTESEPWKDRDTLNGLYHHDDLNQSEIADELNTSPATISYWMDKHKINTTHTSHESSDEHIHEDSPCSKCGTDVPNNAQMCTSCLDEARSKDSGVA